MGSSYAATCYALEELRAIDTRTRGRLLDVSPRQIKQKVVGQYQPSNWFGDVWLVTSKDEGMVLEGSRTDLVVFEVEEHIASGYVWQFSELVETGLAIKEDGRRPAVDEACIGGVVFRTVIAEAEPERGASGHVMLQERRPWDGSGRPLNSIQVDISFSGPVPAGLLPAQRAAALAAA
jgi:hypothetical protein